MRQSTALAAILTCLLGLANSASAFGGADYDTVAVRVLNVRVPSPPQAMVRTKSGNAVVAQPAFDYSGVRYQRLVESMAASPRESLQTIRWSEIQKVQVKKSAWGWGALVGLTAGLAVGIVSIVNETGNGGDPNDQLLSATLGIISGMAIGGLIAAPFKVWKTVYPIPHEWKKDMDTVRLSQPYSAGSHAAETDSSSSP